MLVRKRSSINNLLFILAARRNVPGRLNTLASPRGWGLRASPGPAWGSARDFPWPGGQTERSTAFVGAGGAAPGEMTVGPEGFCAGVKEIIFIVIKLRKCSLHGEIDVLPLSFSSVFTCLFGYHSCLIFTAFSAANTASLRTFCCSLTGLPSPKPDETEQQYRFLDEELKRRDAA